MLYIAPPSILRWSVQGPRNRFLNGGTQLDEIFSGGGEGVGNAWEVYLIPLR